MRPEIAAAFLLDKESCVSLCSFNGDDSGCYDVSMTNSIAAGCTYAGFVVPGHDCGDDTSTKFRNNVAHSCNGGGAFIHPDITGSGHKNCYEGSYFSSYKTTLTSIATHFVSQEIRMSHMTLIDAGLGINIFADGDTERQIAVFKESDVYGETEADDCPPGHPCWCRDKKGMMLFAGHHGSKDYHIGATSPFPMHNIMSYGSWAITTDIYKVTFHNFQSETQCGAKNTIFELNPFSSDFVPTHKFYGTTFDSVHENAFAYIMDPPERWNNLSDCISFPCTAPNNIILDFQLTSYTGDPQPFDRDRDFQVVSDNEGAVEAFDNCFKKEGWNAWQCNNDNLG